MFDQTFDSNRCISENERLLLTKKHVWHSLNASRFVAIQEFENMLDQTHCRLLLHEITHPTTTVFLQGSEEDYLGTSSLFSTSDN